MSKPDVKTIEKLKSFVTFEEDHAVALDKDFRGLGNEALREIIDSVAIDSRKHAGLRANMFRLKGGV